MIQTLNGLVDENKIKNMLFHEHFAFGKMDYKMEQVNNYNRKVAYARYINVIALMKEYHVNFVLDATPIECGRDPMLLKALSQETGMHIVCATGFFKDEGESLAVLKSLSYILDLENFMANLFVKEIQSGIGETGCRAGVIKVATGNNCMTALERSIFISAARAQRSTNVPVITHCERGTMGEEQAELLVDLGVSPQKIVIGHMTSNHSLVIQRKILEKGVFIGYDQFGIESIPDIPKDEEKIQNLIILIKEGFENQILISHDTLYERMGVLSKSKPRLPNLIFEKVIPALHEAGITDVQINKILGDNQKQLFKGGDYESSN